MNESSCPVPYTSSNVCETDVENPKTFTPPTTIEPTTSAIPWNDYGRVSPVEPLIIDPPETSLRSLISLQHAFPRWGALKTLHMQSAVATQLPTTASYPSLLPMDYPPSPPTSKSAPPSSASAYSRPGRITDSQRKHSPGDENTSSDKATVAMHFPDQPLELKKIKIEDESSNEPLNLKILTSLKPITSQQKNGFQSNEHKSQQDENYEESQPPYSSKEDTSRIIDSGESDTDEGPASNLTSEIVPANVVQGVATALEFLKGSGLDLDTLSECRERRSTSSYIDNSLNTQQQYERYDAEKSGATMLFPKLPKSLNSEAYCEICNKEFCNKYFLKTHKANRHGIYTYQRAANVWKNKNYSIETELQTNLNTTKLRAESSMNNIEERYFHTNFNARDTEASRSSIYKAKRKYEDYSPENLTIAEHTKKVKMSSATCTTSNIDCWKSFVGSGSYQSQPKFVQSSSDSLDDLHLRSMDDQIDTLKSPKWSLFGGQPPAASISPTITTDDASVTRFTQSAPTSIYTESEPRELNDIVVFPKQSECKSPATNTSNPDRWKAQQQQQQQIPNEMQSKSLWDRDDVNSIYTSIKDPNDSTINVNNNSILNINQSAADTTMNTLEGPAEEDSSPLHSNLLCNVCGQYFTSKDFYQHLINDHINELNLKKIQFIALMERLKILFQDSSKSLNRYNCTLCSEHFYRYTDLQIHILEKHVFQTNFMANNLNSYTNDSVNMNQSSNQYLITNHQSSSIHNAFHHHGKVTSVSSPRIDETEVNKALSDIEDKDVVITTSYCNICNKHLCNKYFMKTHMQKMHGIKIKKCSQIAGVTCHICNKKLCSKYFLRAHTINMHSNVIGLLSSTSSNSEGGACQQQQQQQQQHEQFVQGRRSSGDGSQRQLDNNQQQFSPPSTITTNLEQQQQKNVPKLHFNREQQQQQQQQQDYTKNVRQPHTLFNLNEGTMLDHIPKIPEVSREKIRSTATFTSASDTGTNKKRDKLSCASGTINSSTTSATSTTSTTSTIGNTSAPKTYSSATDVGRVEFRNSCSNLFQLPVSLNSDASKTPKNATTNIIEMFLHQEINRNPRLSDDKNVCSNITKLHHHLLTNHGLTGYSTPLLPSIFTATNSRLPAMKMETNIVPISSTETSSSTNVLNKDSNISSSTVIDGALEENKNSSSVKVPKFHCPYCSNDSDHLPIMCIHGKSHPGNADSEQN